MNLLDLLRPWRGRLILVSLAVLGAAAFEVVPPLVLRTIVDAHLTPKQPAGLLSLAGLYLAAGGSPESEPAAALA